VRLSTGEYVVWRGRLCKFEGYRFEGYGQGGLALEPLPPQPGPYTFAPRSLEDRLRWIDVTAVYEGDEVYDVVFEGDGTASFKLMLTQERRSSWPPSWPEGVLTRVEDGRPSEGWAEGRAPVGALSDIAYRVPVEFREFVTPDGYLIESGDRG